MNRQAGASLVQRLAAVGTGLAAFAGSALLVRSSRGKLRQALGNWLGFVEPAAAHTTPQARASADAASSGMNPPPLPPDAKNVGLASLQPLGDLIWSKPGAATTHEAALNVVLTISRSELKELLTSVLPMRLRIEADGEAWIEIEEIESMKYHPGHGLVFWCSARVSYPIPVLPDGFTLKAVGVEVVPQIIQGEHGPVLAFKLDLADLDVKYLPDFVDDVIAAKINGVLRDNAAKIAWDFSKTLNRTIELPEDLTLLRQLILGPARAVIEVASEGLVLRCALPLRFVHPGAPVQALGDEARV